MPYLVKLSVLILTKVYDDGFNPTRHLFKQVTWGENLFRELHYDVTAVDSDHTAQIRATSKNMFVFFIQTYMIPDYCTEECRISSYMVPSGLESIKCQRKIITHHAKSFWTSWESQHTVMATVLTKCL